VATVLSEGNLPRPGMWRGVFTIHHSCRKWLVSTTWKIKPKRINVPLKEDTAKGNASSEDN